MTSKIQLCDVEIIDNLKLRYCNYQMDRVLNMVEDHTIWNIHEIEILSDTKAIKRI